MTFLFLTDNLTALKKSSAFTSNGLHQWKQQLLWLPFSTSYKNFFLISVENSPGFWLCVRFLGIYWNTVVDTHRHICSKKERVFVAGLKSIFILHIASRTVGIIFKMPSFKGVLLETAMTLWLTDLCSDRTFFIIKMR